MKYKDPQTGEFKDITVKASDTLPIGTIVDYDGDIVPDGWETVDDTGTYKKIKKIATSIGVLGKILNSKSSSKQDTYSCKYLNKSFNVAVSPNLPNEQQELWARTGPSLKLGEKGYSQTLNGMTITINDKYEIILNGTTSKETQFDIKTYPISKNENIMSVKGGNENCQCGIYFFNDSGVYVASIRSTNGSMVIQSLTDNMTKYEASIKIPAGTSLNNYQPKMQIIYGSNNIEYSAYVEPAIYARTNESYNLIATKNTYDEGETLIGEFLGKPLYRQVITKNITSTSQAVSDVFKNLNTIVSINGIFTGADYIIPYGFNNDKTFVAVFYEKSSNTLQFRSNYSSGKTRTILEYTKITD